MRTYRPCHDCGFSLPTIRQCVRLFNQGIIGGLAQLFFAWRIYVLTKNLLVVSAIVLLGGVSILSSVGTTIGVRVVPQFVHFQKFEVIAIIWLASAACADVIIATVLVLYLVGDAVNPSFSYVNIVNAEESKKRISFHGRSHRSHH